MDLLEQFKQLQKEQFMEFQTSQRQDYEQFQAEQQQKYREFQEQQSQQYRKLLQKDHDPQQDESLDNASPTSQTDQWTAQKPLPVRRRGRPPRKPQNQSRSPSGESEVRTEERAGVLREETSMTPVGLPMQPNGAVQKRRGRPPKLPNLWVNANGEVVRKRGRPPKNPRLPLLLETVAGSESRPSADGLVPFTPVPVPTQPPRKRGRPRKYPLPEDAANAPSTVYEATNIVEDGSVDAKPRPQTRSRLDILVQQAQEIIQDDAHL